MATRCLTCEKWIDEENLCHACDRLLRWVQGYFDHRPGMAGKISLSTDFVRELAVESLDWMIWILEAEGKLGVVIEDDDAERIHTVGEFIQFLRQADAVWPEGQRVQLRPRTWCLSPWEWDVVEDDVADPA